MLRCLSAFLFIAVTTFAIAEPTPLVTRLMDTPASMFDIGMIKVQKQLDSLGKGYTVSYSWEKNKFLVQKYFLEFSNDRLDCKTEASCKEFLKLMTEKETESLCIPIDDSCSLINIASEFSHSGYSTKNFYNGKNDTDSVQELRNLFYVGTTLIKKFNGVSKKITCERAITEVRAMCSDVIEVGKK